LNLWQSYQLRIARRRWRVRALRKSKELRVVSNKTAQIEKSDVLVFSTFRNEAARLPYFLKYYRDQGVKHFIMVDNGSDDGGGAYLEKQPDVSLWHTDASYLSARFGVDWAPEKAPALNKVPLIKWRRRYTYASSTHMVLPRGLNLVFDEDGGEKASGVLLHTKFLNTFSEKAIEELERGQHYDGGAEYKAYAAGVDQNPDMWCKWSDADQFCAGAACLSGVGVVYAAAPCGRIGAIS